MKTQNNSSGFILTAVLMLVLIGSMIAGAFVISSRQTMTAVDRWRAYDECLLAAQTALEKVKANLFADFSEYHSSTYSWTNINWLVAQAESYSTTNVLLGDFLGVSNVYASAVVSASITKGNVVGTFDQQLIYITNRVTATWNGVTRAIEETVRYKLNKSSVFDHSYFINNFGWFSGVDLIMNGDSRSNYNIDLNASSLVMNGNSYASGTNVVRRTPSTWSWTTYRGNAYKRYFRPAYNVDYNAGNTASRFEPGFKTNNVRYNNVSQLDMPYIGNLNDFKYYAQHEGGTIKTGSTVIVDAVYDGVGPSGITNAPDQGCVVLVGTSNNPIRLDGPIVVDGDVIIKGYYTGQGTIYAGRNIHIIDDLIATNPPGWTHPDTAANFTNTTLPNNLNKDFMGLCAKGSIVLGDYRASGFQSSIAPYIKPPFTAPYPVTGTDANIGYVSYVSNGTNYFNGDYTATYGFKCGATATSDVPRKYFESSLSDAKLGTYSPQASITRIDAMIYNNHVTAGKFDSNSLLNGGIICRDEALILSGRLYINWDSRIALDVSFKPYLPMELGPAKTILWRELAL